ncbi:hypothetical protein [Candidatus Tisiphia endosymbiont of Hybos culiciformis]|uniref:hypothetical protein n=1 Tax=Candidatus Tisiphia endosymbiont of Hybos culiciformis TaxID=3139331 RepID=UPI003CCAFDC0
MDCFVGSRPQLSKVRGGSGFIGNRSSLKVMVSFLAAAGIYNISEFFDAILDPAPKQG